MTTGPHHGAPPHLPTEAWRAFLEDTLSDVARRHVESHLGSCTACEAAIVAAEPALIFRRLRGLRVREETWVGFWDQVAPQLEPRTASRSRHRGERAPVLAFLGGAAAAVIVLVSVHFRSPATPRQAQAEDPCPPSAVALHLTRAECAALYGKPPRPADPPVMILESSLDLRGL